MQYLRYVICSALFLIQLSSFIHATSKPLTICNLTKEAMSQGMGGMSQNLGFSIKAYNGTAELVLPANSKMLKGLFIFALDESGKSVGTWTSEGSGFVPVMSNVCPNGAITHSDANLKMFSANPKFFVKLPTTVRTATVKAFVVQNVSSWQEVDSVSLMNTMTNSTMKSGSLPNASFLVYLSGLVCLMSFMALF
ncbi:hypothetical protein HMI56_000872 [Coelomomyces lativittatus]|nr:hypothetical protein HMI56_000872 [Coelomomyces lativittatus]